MRICVKCRNEKPVVEFGIDRHKPDGKHQKCKICVNQESAEYRSRNPEKRKFTCATYRAKNAEKVKQAWLNWKNKDPIRANRVQREWVNRNKESVLATKARWRAENHSKTREISANRSSASGNHIGKEISSLVIKQKHKCACCAVSIKDGYHKDHIQPLKSGGSNDILNIQLLCAFCNLSKGAKCPIEFMQQRGFLL